MTTFAPRLHDDPPRFVTSRLLEEHGLPHLFTTRHFPGVVRPTEPRPPFGPEATPLLAPRGLGAQPAFAKQVHGAAVLRAERGGFAGHGDALATVHRGLPLVISTIAALALTISGAFFFRRVERTFADVV